MLFLDPKIHKSKSFPESIIYFSSFCLDLIIENPTRKHIKKISDSENDNKQDKHLIEYKNSWMSENKEEFINSVKYSRFATENLQSRQTSLSNPTQQNIDSYVNNLCNIYIEAGKKTNMCRKTKTKNTTHSGGTIEKKWYLYSTLLYSIPYYTILCYIIHISYHIISYLLYLYHIIPYHTISYNVIPYHTIAYHSIP